MDRELISSLDAAGRALSAAREALPFTLRHRFPQLEWAARRFLAANRAAAGGELGRAINLAALVAQEAADVSACFGQRAGRGDSPS